MSLKYGAFQDSPKLRKKKGLDWERLPAFDDMVCDTLR